MDEKAQLARDLEVAANGVLDAANEWHTADPRDVGARESLHDAVKAWRAAGEAFSAGCRS